MPYEYGPADLQLAESHLTEATSVLSAAREKAIELQTLPEFFEDNGTIVFSLNNALISSDQLRQQLENEGFMLKQGFHMTVVGFREGRKIKQALKKLTLEDAKEKIKLISQLIETTDWTVSSASKIFRIEKSYENGEKRESIIQQLNLNGAGDLITKLNQLLGITIFLPFPHLTLFTKSSDLAKMNSGIGIESEAEFMALNPRVYNSPISN